jgi:hypothetical protein
MFASIAVRLRIGSVISSPYVIQIHSDVCHLPMESFRCSLKAKPRFRICSSLTEDLLTLH